MVPDVNRISVLIDHILVLREKLISEIAESCPFDPDLANHVCAARDSLYEVYKDLDQILVDCVC